MKTKRIAAVFAVMCLTLTAVPASAEPAPCENPTVSITSSFGRPIAFVGRDIGHAAILNLWAIVEDPPAIATPFLGKVIAADQNWLGSCQYPGIGIGAGSGFDLNSRSVYLWIWSSETDLAIARASVLALISPDLAPTTTTTTTTTTIAQETAVVGPLAEKSSRESFAVTTSGATTTTAAASLPSLEPVPAIAASSVSATQLKFTTSAVTKTEKKKCKVVKKRVFSKKKKKVVTTAKKVCR